MAETNEDIRGALLMRHGKRASDEADATLDKDGPEGNRGEAFIRRLTSREFSTFPFNSAYIAPSPICRDTLNAIARNARETLFINRRRPIVETPAIHTQEGLFWADMIAKLGGHSALAGKTLADLKTLADSFNPQQWRQDGGETNFILQEGARIFDFIKHRAEEFPRGGTALCIMHSPLIEAVVLWLMERMCHELFYDNERLSKTKMLDHCDAVLLAFREREIDAILFLRFEEKLKKAEGIELETETFRRRLFGRR